MSKGKSRLFSNTAGAKYSQYRIPFLGQKNDDFIKSFRSSDGQNVRLISGNDNKGLDHIKKRHSKDIENAFEVKEDELEAFIIDVIKTKELINVIKSNDLHFYKVNDIYSLGVVISHTSLEIITAYPIRTKKALKMKEKNNGK